MTNTDQLTEGTLNDEENKFEEEWEAVLSSKNIYVLSKAQAQLVLQAMATGSRSTIPFQTFVIPIPYLVDFHRVRRFLKETKQLPAQAQEKEYVPISEERMAEIRKEAYSKIGKRIPGAKEE